MRGVLLNKMSIGGARMKKFFLVILVITFLFTGIAVVENQESIVI
jgi:hypothetical protein